MKINLCRLKIKYNPCKTISSEAEKCMTAAPTYQAAYSLVCLSVCCTYELLKKNISFQLEALCVRKQSFTSHFHDISNLHSGACQIAASFGSAVYSITWDGNCVISVVRKIPVIKHYLT